MCAAGWMVDAWRRHERTVYLWARGNNLAEAADRMISAFSQAAIGGHVFLILGTRMKHENSNWSHPFV
jgi:hypothetical protein